MQFKITAEELGILAAHWEFRCLPSGKGDHTLTLFDPAGDPTPEERRRFEEAKGRLNAIANLRSKEYIYEITTEELRVLADHWAHIVWEFNCVYAEHGNDFRLAEAIRFDEATGRLDAIAKLLGK